jgi:hypothetical protein
MSEPRMVFLGAVDVTDGEAIVFDIPPNADAAKIQAAILKANAERAVKQAQESKALEKLFLNKVAIDKGGEK